MLATPESPVNQGFSLISRFRPVKNNDQPAVASPQINVIFKLSGILDNKALKRWPVWHWSRQLVKNPHYTRRAPTGGF
jgi:hypothetical protein